VGAALLLFASSLWVFTRLGAQFVPQLDEGTMLISFVRSSSAGLGASVDLQKQSEKLLLQKFPEIAERPLACAIYGRVVADSYSLRADDRVEILRPLQADPKERRRAAARDRTPKK